MTASIHPSAIVDPQATLADDVEIGPFAIIGPEVTIGARTKIGPYVQIDGNTTLGEDNEVFSHTTLGFPPQHLEEKGSPSKLIIGDGNTLREYVNIHRGFGDDGVTRVGDRNYLMGKTHIAHDCQIGNGNIMANSVGISGHAIVGDRAFISGLTGVHQHCRIGDLAMIGGVSKVTQDIPPFMTADGHPAMVHGLNALGMRRAGIESDARKALKRMMRIIFASGLNLGDALDKLEAENPGPEGLSLIKFCRESKRGIASSSIRGKRQNSGE